MATDLNVVALTGRLTKDPEVKYLPSGMTITNFGFAVGDRTKQGDTWTDYTHFLEVTVFGKQAEAAAQYLKKGSRAAVEGKLRQSRWEDNGQKRSKVEIVANSVVFLTPKAEGGNGAQVASVEEDGLPF